MLHDIPTEILARMKELEIRDAQEQTDGTPRLQKLRQIPPNTGRFLAIMAASAPPGEIVEIGTSAGYSTMWLSLAAKIRNQKVITFELMEEKIRLAKETFKMTHLQQWIDLREGDALENLDDVSNISFAFLDCEKELYMGCYKILIPKLVSGGLLVCDNAINQQEILQPMMDYAEQDTRVDAIMVPIGKGEFLCRKV